MSEHALAPAASRRLVTYDEVAERLSCRKDHVFALARENQLPVVYIGPRQPRVRESDLEEFIAARTIPAKPRHEENN